jgi:hypothetical protein
MAIVFDSDAGTITGLSVGGLPDGIVDAGTLATNSVDSAELIDGAVDDSHMASISGRKNWVLNGNLEIWQRGTSFTDVASNSFSADRWKMTYRPNGNINVAQVDNVIYKGLKYTNAYSSAQTINVEQLIEDVSKFSSKSFTLSFYAKANTAITLTNIFYANYGSGGSTQTNEGSTTHSVTTTRQQFTHTFTATDMSGKTIGANNYMRLYFEMPFASQNDWLEIDTVQLEVGSTATDFEHKSYGEELALCQRYFERIAGAVNVAYSSGSATYANQPRTVLFYKTQKRVVPTLSSSTASEFRFQFSNSVNTPSAISLASIGVDTAFLNASGITISADTPCTLISNSSSSYLDFSSEL